MLRDVDGWLVTLNSSCPGRSAHILFVPISDSQPRMLTSMSATPLVCFPAVSTLHGISAMVLLITRHC